MTTIETLRRRSEIVRRIRAFFDRRGYLAAETPRICPTPIPEAHIELMKTSVDPPSYRRGAGQDMWLLPSPEYYLKQLIARGAGSVYEIARSYRNGESRGPYHAPEFTMLEYYTADADAEDSLQLTHALLADLGETRPPVVISMREAFGRWCGIDLAGAAGGPAAMPHADRPPAGRITDAARAAGINIKVGPEERWDEVFQRLFLSYVEPRLPRDRPVFLTHYPAAVPTLARRIKGTPWADRWELYLGGVETANCFGEETEPERIRAFLDHQHAEIERGPRETHPVDRHFLQHPTLPRCSGVALGVDRLVMHLVGAQSIGEVLAFEP